MPELTGRGPELAGRGLELAGHGTQSGVRKCGSDPTSTRAGGQDDVSLTNSLKLINPSYPLAIGDKTALP